MRVTYRAKRYEGRNVGLLPYPYEGICLSFAGFKEDTVEIYGRMYN